jgi:hypothetical protein
VASYLVKAPHGGRIAIVAYITDEVAIFRIQRISSGKRVPRPRTCRSIDPRFTSSIQTPSGPPPAPRA